MFIKNKYTKWYFNIIAKFQKCENITKMQYYEKHHIIPKSLGGSNDNKNIVALSAKAHYICHLLLPYMTSNLNRRKMIYARWCMTYNKDKTRYRFSSKLYEQSKREYIEIHKITQKGRTDSIKTRLKKSLSKQGNKNFMFGKNHTPEARKKISENRIYNVSGKNNNKAKKWKITDPNNNVFIIHGELEKFCIEHNLIAWTLANAAKTQKIISKGICKGWKSEYIN